ncbi:TetR/AcrR family transcriptional regulator [Methylosinus sp. Sm6]|uniref:TetR/AcrR family transcriptional regulator n=1 Tax=Methylosinus sp. Sm6 TaxID=2866948 RepID=UPI001C99BC54|nr:TetR/AcrR family transcriptional regulator [Methylosinus sp. Sm6]MBY6243595.1 TetR family transcriptional regulator [Methylosinus sp. Sm6]
MREEKTGKRSAEATKQKVLAAAISRFARASYEEVRLRDIAADVRLDVALVHRAFGSKDQLFAAVIAATSPSELVTADREALCAAFARRNSTPCQNEGLQIFIRSLTSPLARSALRAHCSRDFVEPLAARLGGPAARQRAALFVASTIGVAILRDILEIDPLCEPAEGDCQPLIEGLLASCLGDDRQGADVFAPPRD